MGILDDAIRQHLDLKRRHGADPSDVAKLEKEAFGPIERDEALGVPDPAAPASVSAATHQTAVEEELAFEEAELEAEEEWATTRPVPADPEPAAQESEPLPDPEPEPRGSVRLDDAPVEHPADPQPDVVPGEHDELEETPEFLQETPEHDRLWFEQKPPRDFDF